MSLGHREGVFAVPGRTLPIDVYVPCVKTLVVTYIDGSLLGPGAAVSVPTCDDINQPVANAAPEVLAAADGVIASNADDAVVTWLYKHLGDAAKGAQQAVGQ